MRTKTTIGMTHNIELLLDACDSALGVGISMVCVGWNSVGDTEGFCGSGDWVGTAVCVSVKGGEVAVGFAVTVGVRVSPI
jgi:hypothetical protein